MAADTLTRPTATSAPVRAQRFPITGWVLRQQRRAIAGWSIALAGICAVYVSFYPAMGGDEMAELISTMPEALVEGLGYGAIGTAPGYLDSTVYSLLAPVLLLVFAVGFGARVIAGQEEEGSLELELTAPVARHRVLLERFAALAAQLVVFGTVVFGAVVGLVLVLDMDVAVGNIAATTLGLVLLALALGTVTLAVGALTGRKATALAVGAGIAVVSFMADVLAPLVEGASWLADLSPFAWYLGSDPLANGLDVAGTLGLAAVTVVALAVAIPGFARRDLGI